MLLIIFLAVISYIYYLGTIPNINLTFMNYSGTLHGLINDPINLPYKFLQIAVSGLHLGGNIFSTRLPSAIIAIITVIIVYIVLQNWHSKRVSFLGAVLFLSSSWVIHAARYTDLTVEYLLVIPALLYCKILLNKALTKNSVIYLVLFIMSFILFIPGSIWLVLLTIFNNRQILKITIFRNINIKKIILLIFSSFYSIGLISYSIIKDHELIYQFSGLNYGINQKYLTINNIIRPIKYLFVSGPNNYYTWLPNTAIFDGFILLIFILGMIFYVSKLSAGRSKFLVGSLIISYMLAVVNYGTNFGLIVTLVYLIAITGLADLLQLWLKQFPFNKVARSFGIILISCLVFLSCLYNYRQYFVAWRYNSTVQSVFAKKR